MIIFAQYFDSSTYKLSYATYNRTKANDDILFIHKRAVYDIAYAACRLYTQPLYKIVKR